MKNKLSLHFRLFGIALVIICITLFVMVSNSPRLRYPWGYRYQYQYIYGHKGDVDFAFMGTSRVMRAIIAPYFADALKKETGKDYIVYDLSRAGRGPGLEYTIIRDFLEQHKVKVLAVHYNDSWDNTVHKNFIKVAKISDVIKDYGTHPDNLFLKTNYFLRILGLKFGENLHILLLKKYRKPLDPKPVTTSDYSIPVPVRPDLLKEWEEKYAEAWKEYKPRHWEFYSEREYRNTQYVHRLVRLARENGTEIVFFYVPRLYEAPISTELIQDFSNEFNASWVQPPEYVRLAMYKPGGYTDPGHVNFNGAERYLDWLADLFQQRYEMILAED